MLAALQAARDKASEYERLEVELDSAIVTAGHTEASHGEGAGMRGSDSSPRGGASLRVDGAPLLMTGSLGMSLAAGVPTSARRRLRQTILLAKELSRSQAEVSELTRLLAAARTDNDELRAVDSSIRAQLDAVAGPQVWSACLTLGQPLSKRTPYLVQEYLIAQLRAREIELKDTRSALEEARAELAAAQSTVLHIEAGRQGLEAELRRLLVGRSEVDTLTELVKVRGVL